METSCGPTWFGRGTLAVAAFLTLALAGPATVAAGAGNWTFGIDAGITSFDSEVADDSDYRADARVGYFFTDNFELEGQIARATAILDTTLTTVTVNCVFNFPTGRAGIPYVLVGAGGAKLESNWLFGLHVEDEGLAYQAAVGTRFYFGAARRFGLRLELSALSEDTFDEQSQHISVTAGFAWRFGS